MRTHALSVLGKWRDGVGSRRLTLPEYILHEQTRNISIFSIRLAMDLHVFPNRPETYRNYYDKSLALRCLCYSLAAWYWVEHRHPQEKVTEEVSRRVDAIGVVVMGLDQNHSPAQSTGSPVYRDIYVLLQVLDSIFFAASG